MIAFLLLLGLLTPASPGERLVLLGTAGGPTPKRTRAAPAQALVIGDAVYVVGCGHGVGGQEGLAGAPPRGVAPPVLAPPSFGQPDRPGPQRRRARARGAARGRGRGREVGRPADRPSAGPAHPAQPHQLPRRGADCS